ncbi:unnamed protein product [Brassicogethes aeneus]|uniref:Uncharacterized protein n=1 Tax=Brassicogethes aeneus TaxID=1431903 RepID=A0A9P0FDN4_BRAAE|nr:unnamed protein product [Brassicogethes aeneus]
MMQEDSNGENSFEIIDKKSEELCIKGETTDSGSSISSSYSIPSPSLVKAGSGGNLLANVPPPTALPEYWPMVVKDAPQNITSQPQSSGDVKPPSQVSTAPIGVATTQPTSLDIRPLPSASSQFPSTQFSAAIPPSKGIPQGPIPIAESPEYDYLGGGFMGLVKEAFSSGGVLSKMAEKAKNSVDSIITTLDPQMSEYICKMKFYIHQLN